MSEHLHEEHVTGPIGAITVCAMSAAFVALVDISIINVSLNQIRASFGVGVNRIGWAMTAYMIANVIVMPLTGWIKHRLGYRLYFCLSLALFTVASALCGLAWNFESFITFRVLQGIGGGALIPLSQSLLLARYPRQKQNIAGGLFGLGAMAGPVVGPGLGGYLIDRLDWPWLFYINVPVGIVVCWLAWRSIREPDFVPDPEPADAFGLVSLALGIGCLQYVLEEGNHYDWFDAPHIRWLAIVAVVGIVATVTHSFEVPHPMVDVRVMKHGRFSSATIINFVFGVTLFAGSFMSSLFCGELLDYAPIEIGRVLLAGNAVDFLFMPLIAFAVTKVDLRVLLTIGLALVAYSLFRNAQFNLEVGYADLVWNQTWRSIGGCFLFIPITLAAFSDLNERERVSAVGLFNLVRELGGSVGTAMSSHLLERTHAEQLERLAESVSAYRFEFSDVLQWMHLGSVSERAHGLSTIDAVGYIELQRQAALLAFNQVYGVLALVVLYTLPLVLVLKGKATGSAVGAH